MVNDLSIIKIISKYYNLVQSERNVARLIACAKNEEYSNDWYVKNRNKCLDSQQYELFKTYINRLQNNEPIQYITHRQYFWKYNYYVNQNVLIPRYDSEVLIEYASVYLDQ